MLIAFVKTWIGASWPGCVRGVSHLSASLLLITLLTALLSQGCSRNGFEDGKGDAKPADRKPFTRRDAQGHTVLDLDEAAQTRIGLKVASPMAGIHRAELKAYGQVLDPAPLMQLTTELATAQVALKTSGEEAARVKRLHSQDNASLRALQTAEAAAQKDQLQVDVLRARLKLAWGNVATREPDLTELFKQVLDGSSALIRVDLRVGESFSSLPTLASVQLFPEGTNVMAAEVLGFAPNVDPQTQGQGLLLLVKSVRPRFVPGAAVTAYIVRDAESVPGVWIPHAAVVRYDKQAWVYVQLGNREFARREVRLDATTEKGWLVTRGLTEQDRVVVTGAQMLLSEERRGEIPTGE